MMHAGQHMARPRSNDRTEYNVHGTRLQTVYLDNHDHMLTP